MFFDVFGGGDEIFFGGVFFPALSVCALGDPPGGIGAEVVFGFEPSFARQEILGAIFVNEGDPFFKGATGFGFEFGDPFLDHGDAGMDVVERGRLGGGFRH